MHDSLERIVGGNVLKHAAVEWKHLPFSEKEVRIE